MLQNLFSGKNKSSVDKSELTDRQPCVAGKFYPGTAGELMAELQTLFAEAQPPARKNLRAIVTPHAGYVFSGQVAAEAFKQIDPEKHYEHIFLIGASHRTYFDGASIYNRGNYITPLGKVTVDLELANRLIAAHKVFEFHPEAHAQEHCLEVQIPFLQYHLKTDFNIVPIVVATQSETTIKKISDALKPFFTAENLFVISSDFSHYPGYEDAKTVDKITAGAIASNSTAKFLAEIASNESKGYKGLSTAMCGWPAMLTLLYITSEVNDIEISLLDYKNSGDAVYGDHKRVVGYWAIAFHQTEAKPDHGFKLTDEDQAALLKIARNAIINTVGNKPGVKFNPDDFSDTLRSRLGVFVSVYVDDELRGCIGRFDPESPLYESVGELAVSSATEDSRFRSVIQDDLDLLSIELSVLTPLKKVDTIDEIEPGRHGIYLKKGFHSGTFLPQVATKNNWNVEEFLGHCAREKAKIGWDGWKNAEIYTYEAIVFGD